MTAETVTGSGSPEETEPTPGEGTVLTAGAGPAALRLFPGLPAQAGAARRWARDRAARPGGPDPDDIDLITAELFANAVLHTRSGSEGGTVTVAVTADGVIHVHDHGRAGPCTGLAAIPPRGGGPREDFGRGLGVITALCTGLAHMPAAWCPVTGPDDPLPGPAAAAPAAARPHRPRCRQAPQHKKQAVCGDCCPGRKHPDDNHHPHRRRHASRDLVRARVPGAGRREGRGLLVAQTPRLA